MSFFKTLLSEFSNENVSVFMVDGSTIRDPLTEPFDIDFTEGDNECHNPDLVPMNEVWVDLDVAPTEVRAVILHELTERRHMIEDGLDYDEAHDLANVAEIYARSHRNELTDLVLAELKLAPTNTPKYTEVKSMSTKLIRKSMTFTVVKSADGVEEIVLNSGLPDRGGDRVFAKGVDTTDWKKNPVVMWLHDYKGSTPAAGIPLGTGSYIKVVDNKLVAGPIRWLENDVFVDRVRNAWNQRVLNTVSIGFAPPENSKDMPRNEFGGTDFITSKLLEYSIVPIPMDANALRIGKEFPDLIEHKENQSAIKDELDYTLELVKANDFNEDNLKILKSLYEELSKRYPGTDTPVINKTLSNITEAIDLCNKAVTLCNAHHEAHNQNYKDLVAGITGCREKLIEKPDEKPEDKPEDEIKPDEKPEEDENKLLHRLVTR